MGSPWFVRKLKLNYSGKGKETSWIAGLRTHVGREVGVKGGWDWSLDLGELVRGGESNGNERGLKNWSGYKVRS